MGTLKVLAISIVILFTLLACALIPQGVQNLFATKTPTATATPTSTPTPTATPLPPISLSPCAFQEYCPDAVNIEDLLKDKNAGGDVVYAMVPHDRPVWLYTGWSTMTEEILYDNLKQIKWVFSIDGQDYFQSNWPEQGVTTFETEPEVEYPGHWFGVILDDWNLGESHTILIGFELKQPINDGWDDYEVGSYVKKYILTGGKVSTATPTQTVAPTAKPTLTLAPTMKPAATKVPLQPSITPPANLVYDMTLKVENRCAEQHQVIMTGPTRLKFTVGPSQTVEYQAPQGTYTWMIDGLYPGGPQDLNINVWTLTLCQ